MMQEEIVNLGEGDYLCGIFTPSPRTPGNGNLCILFLNAGLIHKVGPNRMYKKLAEAYRTIGFSSLRLDFSGLGDSGFPNEKGSSGSAQIAEVRLAMDWLQENKGIDHFILSGMCTGAEAAWEASLDDRRVVGLSLIDGIYTDNQLLRKIGWKQLRARYYKKHLFSGRRWLKVFSGKSKLLSLRTISAGFRVLASLVKRKKAGQGEAVRDPDGLASWEALFGRNVKVHLVFCEGAGAIDVYNLTLSGALHRYRKTGLLQVTFIKDVDHTFTPIWSQRYLSELTTAWLKKEFEL